MRLDITPYADLATAKLSSKDAIDAAAGRARQRYITSVPGQAETYLLKAQEADTYAAAGYPADLTQYPWLTKETQATGMTPRAAADAIIAQRDAWVVIGSSIELERRKGKLAVDASAAISDAIKARDLAIAALDAL